MKLPALYRQIGLLAIISIAVTGLVIYVMVGLLAGDRKGQAADHLHGFLHAQLRTAEDNFAKTSEGDSTGLQRDVSAPLASLKTVLNSIYDGKVTHPELIAKGSTFSKPESEDRKLLLKQALVSIEKLQDQLKLGDAKATAQFDVVKTAINSVVNEYKAEAATDHRVLTSLAWFSVLLLVVAVVVLIAIAWLWLKKSSKEVTSARQNVIEENKRVEQLSAFIEAMATGNYDMQIATDANDELSATLVSMRDKLKNNAEEEKRRNWANTGLAKIGELLRHSGNATELYDSVIRFLVKYTQSNQGGLFILDDSDAEQPYLNLVACYAFERKKFLTKKVSIGEGLVGQCFLEQEEIHLTEMPDEYIRITSGLGGEKPQSCLLMPLKVNDKVYGVLELASFHLYAPHVVELVAKFAENIASTISNVKINESTRILLEQTQKQAEEMKSQEEEMRQNMEELSATQEEMHRKEREYISRIEQLEAQAGLVEKI